MKAKRNLCYIMVLLNIVVLAGGGILLLYFKHNVWFSMLQIMVILFSIIFGSCFGESVKNSFVNENDALALREYEKKMIHLIMIWFLRILVIGFFGFLFCYIMLYLDGEGTITHELIEQNNIFSYLVLGCFHSYYGKYVYRAGLVCQIMYDKEIILRNEKISLLKVSKDIPTSNRWLKFGQIPVWIFIIIMIIGIAVCHMFSLCDMVLVEKVMNLYTTVLLKLVPIVVIIFIISSAQMEPLKDEWENNDAYSKSKVYLVSLHVNAFLLVYHGVSFFGKTYIGTGSFTATGTMMDPLKQFPMYCFHETMFYWGLILLVLHVFLLFIQKRYEYEVENIDKH